MQGCGMNTSAKITPTDKRGGGGDRRREEERKDDRN